MRITQTDFYKKLLGRLGEKKAEKFLKRKKYKIIEKNFKTKFAECDLIALYGNLLVFIEVKTRSSVIYGNPADAVGFNKQKKYVKLAEYFLACNSEYKDRSVRFDVIEILNDEINHIEGAFYADDL